MVALMGKRLVKNLPGSQQGMALITGLLLLMVLTLLGITAMDNAVMEETMVKNQRDKQVAFQAAESAMVDSFGWLDTQQRRPWPGREENGLPVMVNAASTLNDTSLVKPAWWASNGLNYGVVTGAVGIDGVAVQPRHITEEFVPAQASKSRDSLSQGKEYNSAPGRYYYRINAQGSGFSAATQVVVQGVYVKRYD